MKNGLSGIERLLLAHPGDRAIGEIFGERVALLGCLRRLDRRRALVQPGIVLVGFAADEAVEVFESRSRRPLMERPDRRDFPDRHFVALAELRGRITVELEGLGAAAPCFLAARCCCPAPRSPSR